MTISPVRVFHDRRFLDYEFGPGHPFDERSRDSAARLLELSLVPAEANAMAWVRSVDPAPREILSRFHRSGYLDRIAAASDSGDRRPLDLGDTPSFPGCFEASARLVAATVRASEAALNGDGPGFVPAGGLHHAGPDRASGFCVFNDIAVAIAGPLRAGRRLAYVDLDAHHGDGVMYGYYDNGRLLDIDLHQDGRTLFPGTGTVGETGSGDGAGAKVNLPLPPGAGDESLVPLLERVALPLLSEFRPELLLVQHGVDGHEGDPLARLRYTPLGYRAADRLLFGWAREARCPVVVTGGGGYRASSVARVLADAGRALAGLDAPPQDRDLPPVWREEFQRMFDEAAPEHWVDPEHRRERPPVPVAVERLIVACGRALGRRFGSAAEPAGSSAQG